ncbi:ovalbumin-like [Pomacea canaliculata]|uniref:ovalbumin-like n=1 Tax=Pomacea canaliculata TaxID=400727 RepID=UPI000D72CC3D|nr:ovalbumin-like [Pomacea canaliculata]
MTSRQTLTLRMADAVYYDAQKAVVMDSYASSMSQYYEKGLKPFQRPNPEQAVNTWVEEVTEGAITNFLQPGAITADTVLMLLNALFFEASWQTMFEARGTRSATFTTLSGAVKHVPMMTNEGEFSVKTLPELDARVLELPYKGRRYSFFIILPKTKNGLTHLEGLLDGQILENVVAAMPRANHFEVYVPKFTLRTHKGLKEPLQALGLKSMFEMSANFTGMARVSGEKVCWSQMYSMRP